jgi:hypothetical protein
METQQHSTGGSGGGRRRRPGPVAKPGRVRVTLYLDGPLAEWGKHREGGLSDLVRRLLAEERSRIAEGGGAAAAATEPTAAAGADPYPAELRAEYRRLVDRRLRSGLSPDEERELEAVRARINALDRVGAAWRERESAAGTVDRELADLRREIEALPPLAVDATPRQ